MKEGIKLNAVFGTFQAKLYKKIFFLKNKLKLTNKSNLTSLKMLKNILFWMARVTGLEPAASGVTGRRSNQTELHPRINFKYIIYTKNIQVKIFSYGGR